MIRRFSPKRAFPCAVLAVCLAGCASDLPQPVGAPAPGFELNGRIAVRTQDRAFTSAVRWKQRAGGDELWLTAPTGQAYAYLEAGPKGASITAEGRRYQAASVESLTRSALGWSLPVAALRYWVRGAAAPGLGEAAVQRDGQDRLTHVEQGPWRVDFHYDERAAGRPLRVDVADGEAELKLVVDSLETLP